jgi:type IV pilus assembly protein PilA
MHRDHGGFSLVELLIVVAIILIIAAIAIPSFLRSRIAANQASAIESMRTIGTAEVTYWVTFGQGFSVSLSVLGPPPANGPVTSTAAGLIDEVLAGGAKSGYVFIYTPNEMDPSTGRYNGYNLNGNPAIFGSTGTAYYFTDQSHVIRGSSTAVASSTDSAVAD